MEVAEFIDRWKRSGGAELANSQSFLKELCDFLGFHTPNRRLATRSKIRRSMLTFKDHWNQKITPTKTQK